jgi:hypothetical protein
VFRNSEKFAKALFLNRPPDVSAVLPLQLRHYVRLRRPASDLQMLPGDLAQGPSASAASAAWDDPIPSAGRRRGSIQLIQEVLRLYGHLQRQVGKVNDLMNL